MIKAACRDQPGWKEEKMRWQGDYLIAMDPREPSQDWDLTGFMNLHRQQEAVPALKSDSRSSISSISETGDRGPGRWYDLPEVKQNPQIFAPNPGL